MEQELTYTNKDDKILADAPIKKVDIKPVDEMEPILKQIFDKTEGWGMNK